MKLKIRPFKKVLLYYIIIPVTAFFAVILFSFSLLLTKVIQDNTLRQTQELSATVQNGVDEALVYMDALSKDIAGSPSIQQAFSELSGANGEDMTAQLASLTDSILPMLSRQGAGVQVQLYQVDNGVFSAGAYHGYEAYQTSFKYWYDVVMVKNGEMHISVPYEDKRLSEAISLPPDTLYVSLLRTFFDENGKPLGIVEIQQLYTSSYQDVIELETGDGHRLMIFDNYGYKMFPRNYENDNYYYQFSYRITQNKPYEITSEETGRRELIQTIKSDFSEQSFVFVLDKNTILEPVYKYQILFVALSMLFIAILVGLLFYTAHIVSDPIRKIQRQIAEFDLKDQTDETAVTSTKVEELNNLSAAFSDMKEKLNDSMSRLLLAQSQEMQSRMLLLQNQINPHFLYNSLAVIAVMAEEGMREEIVATCDAMADILRYLSADDNGEITLEQEIDIVIQYLSCMELRYQQNLQYSVQIAPALYHVQIPKLVLQLLVENSIKYASSSLPPWDIQIIGSCLENGWAVSVIDNGPGFAKEVLDSIMNQVNSIKQTHLLPSLKLDGMGLLNIFIRLYLKFGEDAVFCIENNPDKGASITVGVQRKENG